MPGLVMEYIKRHWNEFSDLDKNKIMKEVKDELEHDDNGVRSIGSNYDKDIYKAFVDWMDDKMRI